MLPKGRIARWLVLWACNWLSYMGPFFLYVVLDSVGEEQFEWDGACYSHDLEWLVYRFGDFVGHVFKLSP
jgi:hypothetical protein